MWGRPEKYFNVNIYVKTTLSNGYGDQAMTGVIVIVKANTNHADLLPNKC